MPKKDKGSDDRTPPKSTCSTCMPCAAGTSGSPYRIPPSDNTPVLLPSMTIEAIREQLTLVSTRATARYKFGDRGWNEYEQNYYALKDGFSVYEEAFANAQALPAAEARALARVIHEQLNERRYSLKDNYFKAEDVETFIQQNKDLRARLQAFESQLPAEAGKDFADSAANKKKFRGLKYALAGVVVLGAAYLATNIASPEGNGPGAVPADAPADLSADTPVLVLDNIDEGAIVEATMGNNNADTPLIGSGVGQALGGNGSPAVLLEGIRFDSGTYDMLAKGRETLKRIAETMAENPDSCATLTIVGHSDASGGREANIRLSFDRADYVKAQLIGFGVEAGRLATEGHGSAEPLQSNDTAAGRAYNRRVEVTCNPL